MRMGHPREGFHMPTYGDPRHSNPMMEQQNLYNQSNFMQQQRNPYPIASDYAAYGMHRMNSSMMNNPQREINGANMSGAYYGSSMSEMPHSNQSNLHRPPSAYAHGMNVNNSRIQQSQQHHIGSMMLRHGQPVLPGHNQVTQGTNQISNQTARNQNSQQSVRSPCQQMSQTSPHPPAPTYPALGSQQQHPTHPPHGSQQKPPAQQQHGSQPVLSGSHPVPQHPMRHPTTQQNPQEVADNILQMASSYPSNHTVSFDE